MSEYILDVLNQTSKLDWVFPFQRTGAFPLDRSSLFSSLADAEAYALGIPEGAAAGDERKLAGTSYVGQTLSVYDAEANTVTLYIIEADRSLKEVGSVPLGDNASIEIVDGKIQLKDFGLGYYAYVPAVKDEFGNIITQSSYKYTEGFKAGLEPRVITNGSGDLTIAWYEPGTETVEDVAANIESVSKTVDSLDNIVNAEGGLVDQVEDLQEEIGHAADDAGNQATGLYKVIEELEKNKANIADVYTKSETDKAIGDAVAASAHLQRVVVNTVEDINPAEQGAENFIYMVPTGLQEDDDKYDEYMVIDGFVEKVGSWEVNLGNYATIEYVDDELAKKVSAVDGSRLMTEAEGAKLASIESEAQKNYISSVTTDFNVNDAGELSLNDIAQSKITGLEKSLKDINDAIDAANDAIDSKVSAKEGYRLISNEEGNKLANIKDLIQDIDADKFTIDENGKLLLNSVEITEIEGLSAALANKVDKVEGSRLITQSEVDKLLKLSLDDEGNLEVLGDIDVDNVQGLADWIQANAGSVVGLSEKNLTAELHQKLSDSLFISAVDEANFKVVSGELQINVINQSQVTNLTEALNGKASLESVNAIQAKVQDLDNILNGYTAEGQEPTLGLRAIVSNLQVDVETNTQAIAVLDEHLTWQDLK